MLARDVICLSTIAFVCVIYPAYAADAGNSTDMPAVSLARALHDYGLAAVAAIMLWSNWRTQERMALALQQHETQLIELVKHNAILAANSTSEISLIRQQWQARKCLADVPISNRSPQ
jgi:hypothetical protein